MITKETDWQGYNKAVIKSIDSDGMIVCDMHREVNGVVVKVADNIGFRPTDKIPFELTDEEIEEIKNPVTDANSTVEITPTGE